MEISAHGKHEVLRERKGEGKTEDARTRAHT